MKTGNMYDFAVNKKKNGPASKLKSGGLERPTAVRFSPDGKYLYIVDFGIMHTSKAGPKPVEGTGVIWRVSKK
jgi:sugar lactone lactonase YvrE